MIVWGSSRLYEEIGSRGHEELEMQVIKAPLNESISRRGIVGVCFRRSRGHSWFAEARSNSRPARANGCESLVQHTEDISWLKRTSRRRVWGGGNLKAR